MLYIYPAVFHKVHNLYWVEFPNFKDIQIYGSSVKEVMGFAKYTLSVRLVEMLEQGKYIAPPFDVGEIVCDDGFIEMVSCYIEPENPIR